MEDEDIRTNVKICLEQRIRLKTHEEKSNRDKAKHPRLNQCSCVKACINTITEENQKILMSTFGDFRIMIEHILSSAR